MPPAVLFPNATTVCITALRTAMTPTVICQEVPATRPTRFVKVFRTGGVSATPVSDAAQITVEAWAARSIPADVADLLAQQARRALHAIAGTVQSGVACYRVDELSGPAELPDPNSNDRRVTFTVIVHLRGT